MTAEQAEAIHKRIADSMTTCDECGGPETILALNMEPDGRLLCMECSPQDRDTAMTSSERGRQRQTPNDYASHSSDPTPRDQDRPEPVTISITNRRPDPGSGSARADARC